MKRRKLHRHSFIHRYRHVYIFITILVISGFLMGCFASRYINAADIEQLSSILTTVPEDMDQYSFFINQFLESQGMDRTVGINLVSFLTSGFLGLPGVALLYGILLWEIL